MHDVIGQSVLAEFWKKVAALPSEVVAAEESKDMVGLVGVDDAALRDVEQSRAC